MRYTIDIHVDISLIAKPLRKLVKRKKETFSNRNENYRRNV